jgi:hypothetical protein
VTKRAHLEAADIERELIDSFFDDEPPPQAKPAAMAALGVLAVGVTASSAATAASGFAPAGTAASVAAPSAIALSSVPKVGVLMVVKWVGVGALGGATLIGGKELIAPPRAHRSAPTQVRASTVSGSGEPRVSGQSSSGREVADLAVPSVPEGVPPSVAARPDETLPKPIGLGVPRSPMPAAREPGPARGNDLPAVALPATETPSASPPPAERSAPAQALAREVQLLDNARREIAAAEPVAALALLDAHDREFPTGALRPEAVVLRIEALMKTGNRRAAFELGERSVGTLPDGYARRIKNLLAQ